jgi:hypothetical protein
MFKLIGFLVKCIVAYIAIVVLAFFLFALLIAVG